MQFIDQDDIKDGDKLRRVFPNGVLGMLFAAQEFVARFDGPQGLAGDEAAVYYLLERVK